MILLIDKNEQTLIAVEGVPWEILKFWLVREVDAITPKDSKQVFFTKHSPLRLVRKEDGT